MAFLLLSSLLRPFWPTEEDVDELQLMVARLRMEKQALLQSKRASAFRGDRRAQRPDQTPAQAQKAELRRQQDHARTLLAWLQKRNLCRAYMVNRLGLALTWDERMQARKLGFLQQEWLRPWSSCCTRPPTPSIRRRTRAGCPACAP